MIGGKKLQGSLSISGSKNAAGPLIAASVLFREPVRFTRVPRLSDVEKLLTILQGIGVEVVWTGPNDLTLNPTDIDVSRLDQRLMKSMRYSILLLGPLLARARRVMVPEPGGCNIGNRPIDEHLQALQQLGATTEVRSDGVMELATTGLRGGRIVLRFSVTATENLIMASVLTPGRTSIRLAAAEPHVQALCQFLVASGARISGIGTHELEIDGVDSLHAPREPWEVIPDTNEIATFAVAAAITKSELRLQGVIPEHLDALMIALERANVNAVFEGADLVVHKSPKLQAFSLQTMIYPGFPTDNQAPFGLLATQCHGTSTIHDPLFESRLGYLSELAKMGANTAVLDPHRAVIQGPTPLHGTEIRSLDLRAGATMVLAGLIAEGETIIHDAEMVYRGYEQLDERLRLIGADIQVMAE